MALIPGTMVWTVRCLGEDGFDPVHIFSTMEKAIAFAEADPRDHVLSDYVLDCPERMDTARRQLV